MNEKQYLRLCDACDQILVASDSTIERVAIGWLHVIREHPVFLSLYHDIFKNDIELKYTAFKWIQNTKHKLVWFGNLIKVICCDNKISVLSHELPSRIDVLFVSHLINPSLASHTEDFYFGSLPNEMVACGRSVVVALINHTTKSSSDYNDILSNCSYPRVILSESLRFMDEITLHRRLKIQAQMLCKKSKCPDSPFDRRIKAKASIEALTDGSHRNMRIAAEIGNLVCSLRPKAIILTYEGHAWERVVFASVRQAVPGIKCFGYQHAALFRLQHAIRRNLEPEYNPDHIFTTGRIGKAELDSACGLNKIPVSILGSNRSSFNNIDFNLNNTLSESSESPYDITCLVIPEGIASECNILFEFSLSCAKVFPNIFFIWRLHPIISFDSLLKLNPKYKSLPVNIIISKNQIEKDIASSNWALYRGSTAIVQSVLAGLLPIYLKIKEEMTINPLYSIDASQCSVSSVNELEAILKSNPSELFYMKREARDYCKEIYQPFDMQVLLDAVK